jgi:hypothetical protein
MWFERHDGLVRIPVPRTFDQRVEQLENRDSVMFESISLPSLRPSSRSGSGRSHGSQHERKDPAIDLSDDFSSDHGAAAPSTATVDLQLRAILDRVHELEAENRQKDAEIGHLREHLARQRAPDELRPDPFRERYEKMKLQYDKLKEALAMEGRVRGGRGESVHAIDVVAWASHCQ